MNTRRRLAFAALALVGLLEIAAAPPPQTMGGAVRTLSAMRRAIGRGGASRLAQARAVLIAPGNGASVLLLRTRAGWSEPAFFDAAGLRHGGSAVILVMNDRGLDEVLRQRGLRLDGPDPIVVGRLGGVPAIGDRADLLLWSMPANQLDDRGFHQDDGGNASWYGHARGAAEIVGGSQPNPRSAALRRLLER